MFHVEHCTYNRTAQAKLGRGAPYYEAAAIWPVV